MSNKDKRSSYDDATPFLSVYPNYDLKKLPYWVRDNIIAARVDGYKNQSIVLPDGRRYNMLNKLNHLSGQEWTYFINSVFFTEYPTKGKEGYAHDIRKVHPTPKPPQLMKDIILFFTKENELVFDSFMGVGGTLLGAALCKRSAIGLDLNSHYIETYKKAAQKLELEVFPTYCGDSVELTDNDDLMKSILTDREISLLLIDPPYANMMSKQKTGGDIERYGKTSTPFNQSDKDLGNMDNVSFLESLKVSIANVYKYMKKNGHVVVFIKDMQPKGDNLNMLHYDVAKKIAEINGLKYKGMRIWADNTAKLYPYGYPFSFVANQIHQYILVFRKE